MSVTSWEEHERERVCCCARTQILLKVHKTDRFVQTFVRECVRTSFSFDISRSVQKIDGATN